MTWLAALTTGLLAVMSVVPSPIATPRFEQSLEAIEPPPDELRAELIDAATGVYRPVEGLSDRLSGYSDVLAVTDVAGGFVVRVDGTVNGSLQYTVVQGVDDLIVAVTTFDRSFAGATLTVLDDGLTFTTDVDVNIMQNGESFAGADETALGSIRDGVIVVTGMQDLESARFAVDRSVSAPVGPEPPETALPSTVAPVDDGSDGLSTGRLIAVFAVTCAVVATGTVFLKRRRAAK